MNFKDISYLKYGNPYQQHMYQIIQQHKLLEILQAYDPIVVGTFPMNINIEGSDVDIILNANDFEALEKLLIDQFGNFNDFKIKKSDTLVCNFAINDMPFELYAQNLATEWQNGYLHMIKEYEILLTKGEFFAEQIRQLKRSGIKTEPAFCQLLGISGNPYKELLQYQISVNAQT